MTTPQIKVIWRAQETWRFYPREIDRDLREIETPRHLRKPPAPIGSQLYYGEEHLGVVRRVKRLPFNRYRLAYDPPREAEPEAEEEPTAKEEPTIKDENDPQTARMLGTLGLDDRIVAAIEEHRGGPTSLPEVSGMTDDELLAIKGIGPASLTDVRNAIAGT